MRTENHPPPAAMSATTDPSAIFRSSRISGWGLGGSGGGGCVRLPGVAGGGGGPRGRGGGGGGGGGLRGGVCLGLGGGPADPRAGGPGGAHKRAGTRGGARRSGGGGLGRQRGLHALRRERHLADPRAGGVEDRVADGGGGDGDGGLAGAHRPRVGLVDQHGFDRGHVGAEIQRPIGPPVDRRHLLIVPGDFFDAARGSCPAARRLRADSSARRDSRSARSRWR